MTKEVRKNTLSQRFNIIKGQINALSELVEKKEDCKKIVTQFYAVNSGVKKIMELYFKENLESCITSSEKIDKGKVEFLLKEIIKNK